MNTLTITKERAILYDSEAGGYYDLGSMMCALGNVLNVLESEFADEIADTEAETVVRYVLNGIAGNDLRKKLWGINVPPTEIYKIHGFIEGREHIGLSLQNVESFRLTYNISISYLPLDRSNIGESMKFERISSFTEIVYALLYYYAFNSYKLAKCAHCGRWFATTTYKNKYCRRLSTFPGYSHLQCEQAVRNILQECKRVKRRIEAKMNATVSAQLFQNPFTVTFYQQQDPLSDNAKKMPTVEHLKEYLVYLKSVEDKKCWE